MACFTQTYCGLLFWQAQKGVQNMPFIVESNRNVREVSVVRREGEFSVVRFTDRGGWETRTNCIRIRTNRILSSLAEAEAKVPVRKDAPQSHAQAAPMKTHFDYEDEYLRREMQKGSGAYRF